MKVAVLITTHCWNSKRRAGFHWIADALWRWGWEVYFVSALTWIEKLKGDYRFKCLPAGGMNKVVQEKERFYSYVWFNAWRPTDLRCRLLNRLTYRCFARYGDLLLDDLDPIVSRANLIIHESTMELLFFKRFKQLNPNARFVYRVSDNLHQFRTPPVVLDEEARIAPLFDCVSVPSPSIYEKFASLLNIRLHPHGAPLDLYDRTSQNPYNEHQLINAIYVGSIRYDMDFLDRASRLFPTVIFHIIGPISGLPDRDNLVMYGEMPYEDTIPYVKFATIGLHPVTVRVQSNKVLQYTYCKLPIVASSINRSNQPHLFYYEFGDDESIKSAIREALSFDHELVPSDQVHSWDDLAAALIGDI
jgi:2-beta-glucuronyltransferase